MTFDIIEISEEELGILEILQLKMLRTAQQKKDELHHKLQKTLREYKKLLLQNGITDSSLYDSYAKEQTEEYEYQVEILREQLIFNMSLREPTSSEDTGDSSQKMDYVYVVDYELSYVERYIIVRDYYLSIPDYNEMIALYQKDEVAKQYLTPVYYNSLFTYFITIDPARKN